MPRVHALCTRFDAAIDAARINMPLGKAVPYLRPKLACDVQELRKYVLTNKKLLKCFYSYLELSPGE